MSCECPNCGSEIENEICEVCGFNFNDTLDCPYRISNRCIFDKHECNVYGLDFEDCKLYLHKSGIQN